LCEFYVAGVWRKTLFNTEMEIKMYFKSSILKLFVLIIAVMSTQVKANNIKVNGFMTVAAGLNLKDDNELYGYDDSLNWQPDSLVGLKIHSQATEDVSATIQFIARGDNDFEPEVEWAYLTYTFNEDLDVMLGRIRIPWNMMSNYLDSRHAYHWVRAPRSVYFASFNSFEGAKLRYSHELFGMESSVHLFAGRVNEELVYRTGVSGDIPAHADLQDWLGLTWKVESDELTLFATYNQTDGTLTNDFITQFGEQLSVLSQSLVDDIFVEDDQFLTYGFGALYDNGQYLVQSEWAKNEVAGFLAEQESFYFSAGYYFDELLIHLTYERDTNDPDYAMLDGHELGDLFYPAYGFLAMDDKDAKAYSIGARYDLNTNTAVKAQLTHENNYGVIGNVLTFSMDYVF
jgi:hypothetical protein